MLVLARRLNESVEIRVPPSKQEQVIRVFALDSTYDKIRIGFDAPKEILILRTELVRGQK